MKRRRRGLAAATLMVSLCAGCGGGTPDSTSAETHVRIARQPPFANLTFLDNMRQLDGRSVITQTIGFTFACQTVISDNTWVFIQDE